MVQPLMSKFECHCQKSPGKRGLGSGQQSNTQFDGMSPSIKLPIHHFIRDLSKNKVSVVHDVKENMFGNSTLLYQTALNLYPHASVKNLQERHLSTLRLAAADLLRIWHSHMELSSNPVFLYQCWLGFELNSIKNTLLDPLLKAGSTSHKNSSSRKSKKGHWPCQKFSSSKISFLHIQFTASFVMFVLLFAFITLILILTAQTLVLKYPPCNLSSVFDLYLIILISPCYAFFWSYFPVINLSLTKPTQPSQKIKICGQHCKKLDKLLAVERKSLLPCYTSSSCCTPVLLVVKQVLRCEKFSIGEYPSLTPITKTPLDLPGVSQPGNYLQPPHLCTSPS
ncbi:hypothetical protein VP01_1883g1 [Puccinia sorghi]|uniref:Uncharacterized protein n=1 Tax=Puccinia sorghi TaxID=27349 RepID=A0A0L6VEX5_9BASI|nr:hypothetical protein VP01_1883g1 [Puccinia sorghi]